MLHRRVLQRKRLWPEAEFVRDYHAVVESNRVDLVLVLTSMQLHFEVTKAALLAGKHVLVEKPMATTLAEGKELLEISKRAGAFCIRRRM